MEKARYIEVEANVRFWEDTFVNDEPDIDGNIPLRKGNKWCPVIDIKTGHVVDWPAGVEANVCYKVRDEGLYWLLDEQGNRIAKWKGSYVPDDILCVNSRGYGDYVDFSINEAGNIEYWSEPKINNDEWEIIS